MRDSGADREALQDLGQLRSRGTVASGRPSPGDARASQGSELQALLASAQGQEQGGREREPPGPSPASSDHSSHHAPLQQAPFLRARGRAQEQACLPVQPSGRRPSLLPEEAAGMSAGWTERWHNPLGTHEQATARLGEGQRALIKLASFGEQCDLIKAIKLTA